MRILHLSDLHFGFDKDTTELEKRSNYQEHLLDLVNQINDEKEINYLVISGDIAWRASITDYKTASDYIKKICNKIRLPISKLIICPGNHDIDRNIAKHDRVPEAFEEADKLYRVEELLLNSRAFYNFEKFCVELGIEPAMLREDTSGSYLVGVKRFEDANFVILNSAWAAISDEYEDKMWIGNNFIETINASGFIDKSKITFAIMHHPESSLHILERTYYDGTKNTYKEIQNFSDLILCGHTHETKIEPKPLVSGGYIISSGSTYVSNIYRNIIACYDIEIKSNFEITSYTFEHNIWKKEVSPKYNIGNAQLVESIQANQKTINVYEQLLDFGFRIESCQESDFPTSGTIIWPVVPRKNVTHIHQAQIELMSLMSNLYNWKVKVLISDCGSKANRIDKPTLIRFVENIKVLLETRNVNIDIISYLSSYFKPSYENAKEVFDYFIKISSNITKKQLTELKNKEYSDKVQVSNEELPVLDYVLPLLQMSVVCQLGKEIHDSSESKKTLILAGSDEINQWGHLCREYEDHNFGTLLIPVLRDDENTDSWQQGIRKYLSSAELHEDIKKGNFGFWCYCMFVKLQELNIKSKLCDYKLTNESIEYWKQNQFRFPDDFDYQKFVGEIWKTIKLAI